MKGRYNNVEFDSEQGCDRFSTIGNSYPYYIQENFTTLSNFALHTSLFKIKWHFAYTYKLEYPKTPGDVAGFNEHFLKEKASS
jgi:hypothetical protein